MTASASREGGNNLSSLTVTQLKALAQERGYNITTTRKADIIREITAQEG